VQGAYRFVRNPMYVAVIAVVLGQVIAFHSWPLLAYLAIVGVGTDGFVRTYEEPTLRRTYGAEYAAYAAAVPRWVPRLTPWTRSGRSQIQPRRRKTR
jgi:protein-S-isoprenylcysteine O-methyltransferase Ste14